MYGPPPDPRQVFAPVEVFDAPWAYGLCLGVGLVLSVAAFSRRPPPSVRAGLFILGQTIALTAPLFAFLDTFVYGSFPTIDKAGSLTFYLDGIHIRMLAHPLQSLTDPAARLIGVHIGHLWVTEAFDLLLSTHGAFNLQGLLYPALGWWCAWLLFREVTGDDRGAILMGFPFGMGLHVFRDLNWYTIEKAAIFWLPLFAWALYRSWKGHPRFGWYSALIFALMCWMNLYLGLVGAVLAGLAVVATWAAKDPGRVRLTRTVIGVALAALPLGIWQWLLIQGDLTVGGPDRFLWERAALDSFTLSPFLWNRLEVHRALNLIALFLAAWGLVAQRRDGRVRFAVVSGVGFMLLALGPVLWGSHVPNPVYMGVRALVPGFWRVAKPEVFFHGTWMLLLGVAALQIARVQWRRRTLGLLYGLFILAWVLMVRTHPAYPPMTKAVALTHSPVRALRR
jgi:hypothetical protein